MSTSTSIEWTDTTWNPVRGCTKVSPGCAHCYAETFAERWRGIKGHAYEQGFDLRLVPDKLAEPLTWKKPRRVFVNSMSDLFQDGVSNEFIAAVFGVMAACPQHTFQVLTKRAARLPEFFSWLDAQDPSARLEVVWQALLAEKELVGDGGPMHIKHCAPPSGPWPLPNVWLGVSVENQHFADERIPLLLQTPAAIRFISAEPLLGPLDFTLRGNRIADWDEDWHYDVLTGKEWASPRDEDPERSQHLDWVIVGGESGHSARPFDIAWARSIVKQCADAKVACFVKQLGTRPVLANPCAPAWQGVRVTAASGGTNIVLTSKKGGDPSEWPTDLRVRQFPQVPA